MVDAQMTSFPLVSSVGRIHTVFMKSDQIITVQCLKCHFVQNSQLFAVM